MERTITAVTLELDHAPPQVPTRLHNGVCYPPGARAAERDPDMREYGRAARIRTARTYLGLDTKELALALNVRLGTVQRWENGQDPIPVGIWDEIERLFDEFDKDVAGVLAQAEAAPDAERVPVRVRRGRTEDRPFPNWWLRAVGEAMRRDPRIEPVFPEDEGEQSVERWQ